MENNVHINTDIITKMRNLIEQIKYHNDLYYNKQKPEIEDFEYDQLFNELKQLEKEYPQYIQKDSPTQKLIAQDGSKIFKKAKHKFDMLSLDNTYNENDLIDFEKRIKNLLKTNDNFEYVVELKFDGLSIELIYIHENTKDNNYKYTLHQAITRGDGQYGEDVTENAKTIKTILHNFISDIYLGNTISIRGEIIIPKDEFARINNELDELGEETFSNPRNCASGSLRQKDPKITASRKLEFMVYELKLDNINNVNLNHHFNRLMLLKNLGFFVYDKIQLCKNINEVIQYTHEIEKIKSSFDFDIDGLVIKINNIELQNKIGETSHHPRWAISYKFKAETKITKLNDVKFTVGRTGNIGIVGIIEPVVLSGATISKVSLHNFDIIKNKDIKIGDYVEIKRAGEVIPEIIKSIKEKRTGNEKIIIPPSKCPICNENIIKLDDEQVGYYCINANCPAQLKEKLIHFASKDAMNIDGLGQNIIELFYDKGILKNIPDIYRLKDKTDLILNLHGFKEKKLNNILNSIELSKQNDLYRLIYGLGIRYIGEKTAKILCKNFDNIDKLINVKIDDLINIDEIGPKVAYSFTTFMQENKQLILELKNIGLNMQSTLSKETQGILDKKTFLFTGQLSISRISAKELVEKNGGIVLSNISKNLDYLVVGQDPGSKLKKAQELGIKIINEKEFLDMLEKK